LKQEESEYINSYIPVIVNGSLIFNSDKVPHNTFIMSATTNICGEQTNVIIEDQNGVTEFPNEIRTLKGKNSQSIQILSTSSNGVKALHNLYEEDEASANRIKHSKPGTSTNCANPMDRATYSVKQNKDNHKILLIGDSRIKRCASELRQILDYEYDVLGFSKPSAKTSDILETAKNEIASFSSNDILILWVEANDISKNNTLDARRSLSKFFEDHTGVNIILIQVPHRHDLITTSCINKEIVKFNMQVKKY
jgi:hypothetical protein